MAAWRKLRNLTALGLEDNRLTSTLPPELAEAYPRLQNLGITGNRLVGALATGRCCDLFPAARVFWRAAAMSSPLSAFP